MGLPDFSKKMFKIGDRVRVEKTGWTGTIVRGPLKSWGWRVRWDKVVKTLNPLAEEESWINAVHLEHEGPDK